MAQPDLELAVASASSCCFLGPEQGPLQAWSQHPERDEMPCLVLHAPMIDHGYDDAFP